MRHLREAEPPRGTPVTVAPGIRRITAANPGPMTDWGTNTYLLDQPGGVVVVDPGPDDPRHVADVLAAAGTVAAILLTHTHHDHRGAVPALRRASGALVHAWHRPAAEGFVADVKLADGDRVFGWQALHTPGHASDHLSFAGPDGVVFSGDHVMAWSTTVVGPPDGSMSAYLSSLHRLLARPDRLFLPGHGPPLPEPEAYMQALLAHRIGREKAVLAALSDEPRTAEVLVAAIYPGLSPTLAGAAARTVAAHLEKLAEDGAAMYRAGGWIRTGELPAS